MKEEWLDLVILLYLNQPFHSIQQKPGNYNVNSLDERADDTLQRTKRSFKLVLKYNYLPLTVFQMLLL